jgi:hypothetical protein
MHGTTNPKWRIVVEIELAGEFRDFYFCIKFKELRNSKG